MSGAVVIAIMALAGTAMLEPAAAQAAKGVKIKTTTHTVNGSLTGSASGTFGSCKVTGTPNNRRVKLKCRGGEVKIKSKSTLNGSSLSGHWKFKGGTGRFAGITGGGTLTGTIFGQSQQDLITYIGKRKS